MGSVTPPIRCIVVDDDAASRTLMTSYVEQHAVLEAVGSYEDAIEAANALQQQDVDLMLLDVEMPNMSGLELVDTLSAPPAIVMVSGHEEYAVDAFDIDATDYLVKPVSYARFLKAIERVRANRAPDASSDPVPVGGGNASPDPTTASVADHVFLKDGRRLIRVNLRNIQWIEAQGDYMLVRAGKERHMINSTMKELEKKLPPDQFVRVHRSHIVRIDQIDDIKDGTLIIGGRMLPIGPSYHDHLIDRIETL
jgi:DNA-binding LytR/AlgR family response regulator